MKSLSICSLAVLALSISTSQAVTYALSGPMDVFQATTNAGNVGNGNGEISGTYDDVTMTLNYSITFQDLTSAVTNMHFHVGSPGVPGGVALGIPGPWSSPEVGTAIPLSAGQEADLLAGDWYVNVHTSSFGGGEIRGQVNVTPIPEPSAALLGMLGLGFLVMRRQR